MELFGSLSEPVDVVGGVVVGGIVVGVSVAVVDGLEQEDNKLPAPTNTTNKLSFLIIFFLQLELQPIFCEEQ